MNRYDKPPVNEALDWQHVSSKPGPTLPLFESRFDRLRNPRNGLELDRLVLSSVDWVNMVALDTEQRCIMIRQYRFGVGYSTLETPGGMVDEGESALAAAKRELLEETGYAGGQWHDLGAVEPNPAIHDNLCHHFLALGVECAAELTLGAGEHIEVEAMPVSEVIAAAHSGEIRHALALSVLARVLPIWPRVDWLA
ncbi:MAG: NUDIX hydrolase [Pseudomonadaceae bacterium]|nr:NUDIX hydrolase [Pseudomonadaceae bacterium]